MDSRTNPASVTGSGAAMVTTAPRATGLGEGSPEGSVMTCSRSRFRLRFFLLRRLDRAVAFAGLDDVDGSSRLRIGLTFSSRAARAHRVLPVLRPTIP